jgi:type I protein arginine methyltransferase
VLQNEIYDLGQFIPLHYHFQMLSDTARMTAFSAAIEQVVTPQHKVVDLGSGTGVMSFFAAKQGARVWAVDYNPALVSASRKFLRENGVSNQVRVFEADATYWLPPEPADVVICEMLHSALLREKQIQVIASFRDAHHLKFGTIPKFLPTATLLGVQPVWQSYDFNGYNTPVPLFQSAYISSDDCYPCSDPSVYKIVDYDNVQVDTFQSNVSFSFNQDTNVNALRFITKNLLTADLSTSQTIDWHSQHIILPLRQLLQLQAGQTLEISFSYQPGDSIEILNNSISIDILSGKFRH